MLCIKYFASINSLLILSRLGSTAPPPPLKFLATSLVYTDTIAGKIFNLRVTWMIDIRSRLIGIMIRTLEIGLEYKSSKKSSRKHLQRSPSNHQSCPRIPFLGPDSTRLNPTRDFWQKVWPDPTRGPTLPPYELNSYLLISLLFYIKYRKNQSVRMYSIRRFISI